MTITTPAQMREAAALLTCPFCGGSNAHILPVKRGDKHRMYPLVRCMGCYLDLPGQNGDYSTDGRTAIAAWNRRALPVAEPCTYKPSMDPNDAGECVNCGQAAGAHKVAEPAPVAVPLSDADREWIDARADELFRANERERGGVRIQTIIPQDFRDYFVATATQERILSQNVPAAQVRAEALEEAAKLPPYDGDGDPAGSFDHHVFVKRDAIRALIKREPT